MSESSPKLLEAQAWHVGPQGSVRPMGATKSSSINEPTTHQGIRHKKSKSIYINHTHEPSSIMGTDGWLADDKANYLWHAFIVTPMVLATECRLFCDDPLMSRKTDFCRRKWSSDGLRPSPPPPAKHCYKNKTLIVPLLLPRKIVS